MMPCRRTQPSSTASGTTPLRFGSGQPQRYCAEAKNHNHDNRNADHLGASPTPRCSGKSDVTATHCSKTAASSRNHCERRLIIDNADVPLAGGCVFHSQHVTRSEVPSLTVRRGYGHDSLKVDDELSGGRRVKLASLQVIRAPARIEP